MPQFDPSKLPGWEENHGDYTRTTDSKWTLYVYTYITLPDEWQLINKGIVIGTFPTDIEHGNALQILAALGVPVTEGGE